MLESQRQLYNAALEERIGAFRKAGLTRNYVDQCGALTEWRRSDPEAGPGLLNVAGYGMRAGGNLVDESVSNRSRTCETLP